MELLTSPIILTIFGATGDLTQRKLLPAIFHLYQKKLLPEHFFVVGFSRRDLSTEDFKEFLHDALRKYDLRHVFDEEEWQEFSGKIYYQRGDFGQKRGYLELIDKLAEVDTFMKACVPRYFYLATPPDKYGTILDFLHQTKLSEGCGQGSDKWTKVMIEKPFGRSLADAEELDAKLAAVFKEEQIYRIDHYLGKETVQNILAFRYGNTIFDAVWNRQFIDSVQITIAETIGVETRGNFYEGVGALRDMAQSHLLELLAAIAMKPRRYDSEGVRSARAKVIGSVVCIEPDEVEERVVRGQYGRESRQTSDISHQTSNVILASEVRPEPVLNSIQESVSDSDSGKRGMTDIHGYREEPNVDPRSNTETYVALKLTLDDPRWHDVPFYLRTGKRLNQKTTEIRVIFKEPRFKLFSGHQAGTNVLTFTIEPNEGMKMAMMAKKVGLATKFEQIPLEFRYRKEIELPDAYERILLDCLKGDQTLFTRTDEVKAAWLLISKIIIGWEREVPDFPNYAAGTWGPKEAEGIIKRDGRFWLLR